MKMNNENSPMFYQRRRITVYLMVICGFRSFLDHPRFASLVFNDVLVVLFCYSVQCCWTSCTMDCLLKQNHRIVLKPIVYLWVHFISQPNRYVLSVNRLFPLIFFSDCYRCDDWVIFISSKSFHCSSLSSYSTSSTNLSTSSSFAQNQSSHTDVSFLISINLSSDKMFSAWIPLRSTRKTHVHSHFSGDAYS